MLTIPRGIIRLTLFIAVLAFYVIRVVIVGLFKKDKLTLGLRHRQQCCKSMIKVLGIDLIIKGNIHEGSYLYISNHRCYLDPVAQLTKITALTCSQSRSEKSTYYGVWGKHYRRTFCKKRE